jgi:Co/Zn/Cd efflux system component
MSSWLIALMFSIGASTWIFSKLQQRTGYGNNQSALIGAAVSGVIIFIITYILFNIIVPAS